MHACRYVSVHLCIHPYMNILCPYNICWRVELHYVHTCHVCSAMHMRFPFLLYIYASVHIHIVNQCLINVKPWPINLFYILFMGCRSMWHVGAVAAIQLCNTECSVLWLNAWLDAICALYMLLALHVCLWWHVRHSGQTASPVTQAV